MNAEKFVEKVREMRQAQIAYFRDGRKQSDLVRAKQLEKEVDLALLEGITIVAETPELEQGTLFQENDREEK